MTEGLQRKLELLLADNKIGAVEMAKGVSVILGEISGRNGDPGGFADLCIGIVKNGPVMAPLVNLVNGALLSLERGRSVPEFCSVFVKNLEENLRRTASMGASLLQDGMRIMTYSNSSTIIETLRAAKDKGRDFEVVLSDAGPVGEGILMAEKVSEMGIQVVLVPDGALFQEMEETDMVMTGADAITLSGLINKIGTRGIASQARLLGKDLVVIATSEKLLPSGVDFYRKELRDPSELYTGDSPLLVKNYYFDLTPMHLLSKVVTENGIENPFDIIFAIKKTGLHPSLRDHFGKIK
jgi:translation initiation factor 2B subunit (eIF-2B alpha/beta/delta family)